MSKRRSRQLKPIHPGEILSEEFLKPMGISQYKLAQDIGVDQSRISQIVRGERAITADTALRLSRYFGVTAEFWVNLQTNYDLKLTRQASGNQIIEQVHPYSEVA